MKNHKTWLDFVKFISQMHTSFDKTENKEKKEEKRKKLIENENVLYFLKETKNIF